MDKKAAWLIALSIPQERLHEFDRARVIVSKGSTGLPGEDAYEGQGISSSVAIGPEAM